MKIALKYLLKLKFCKVDGYLFSMFTRVLCANEVLL